MACVGCCWRLPFHPGVSDRHGTQWATRETNTLPGQCRGMRGAAGRERTNNRPHRAVRCCCDPCCRRRLPAGDVRTGGFPAGCAVPCVSAGENGGMRLGGFSCATRLWRVESAGPERTCGRYQAVGHMRRQSVACAHRNVYNTAPERTERPSHEHRCCTICIIIKSELPNAVVAHAVDQGRSWRPHHARFARRHARAGRPSPYGATRAGGRTGRQAVRLCRARCAQGVVCLSRRRAERACGDVVDKSVPASARWLPAKRGRGRAPAGHPAAQALDDIAVTAPYRPAGHTEHDVESV